MNPLSKGIAVLSLSILCSRRPLLGTALPILYLLTGVNHPVKVK